MVAAFRRRIAEALPRIDARLFPPISPNAREIPLRRQVALFLLMTACFSLVGVALPANDYLGFDWMHFFRHWETPFLYYPPWTNLILRWFNWPLLVGLTLAGYMLAVIRRSVHPLSAAAAIVTLPLFWAAFLGQLEGLVLIGLSWLPWLAPLALIKPQVAVFALLSRKSSIIAALAAFLASLLIWGFWPLRIITNLQTKGALLATRGDQDIGIGLAALPVCLLMLWFSRGDMDMLMLAGAVGLPYLIPYHLMPVTPAVARLKPWKAVTAGLLSWLPLSANWVGPRGWWLGWLFIAWLWLNLAAKRYPESVVGKILR